MCGISLGGAPFRRLFGSRFSTQISMRFCIDFGSQIDPKMGPKSIQILKIFSLGAASVFFRSRFAFFSCFFIVCWNVHLHFSFKIKGFLMFFLFTTDRVATDIALLFRLPFHGVERRTKIRPKITSDPSKKQLRIFILFFNDFSMKNGSKIEPKMDQKSAPRGESH